MTTTEDPVLLTPAERRQPVVLCVAVGAVVTLGWVLYRHYWADDLYGRILQWDWLLRHFWAVTLTVALVLCVPYAVALLVWGRGLRRRVAGAAAALGAGLFFWGWDRVFQDYVWDSGPPTQASTRVYLWGSLLVLAALVPLAWGLARRSGTAWLLGIGVGPVVAAVLRELELHWAWWHDRVSRASLHHHGQLEALVFVAPFVSAVLAGWALEVRARRAPARRP
jgi:hypothetical protein